MERYIINKTLGEDINISIPIIKTNTQVGLSESIKDLVKKETENSINPYLDDEKIAYKSFNPEGITVSFRFYNNATASYEDSYAPAGFNMPDDTTKNIFKKSFFRLYFYDNKEIEKRELVLFEELTINETITPTLNLKRIYWFRNDSDFKDDTINDKTLYVIGRFFNASTGKVHDFINLPINITTPITITEYSQNDDYWTSPLLVVNPNTNNGNYNIEPKIGVGANTQNSITLTEQIIL